MINSDRRRIKTGGYRTYTDYSQQKPRVLQPTQTENDEFIKNVILYIRSK